MDKNSNEFLPIAILGNRYAVLIKNKFLEVPSRAISFESLISDFKQDVPLKNTFDFYSLSRE
jgi:hypothetical protein